MMQRNPMWQAGTWAIVAAVVTLAAAPAQAQTTQLQPVDFGGPILVTGIEAPDLGAVRGQPANARVRVEYAGLRQTRTGVQFYAIARCIMWAGLDASGNRIPYSPATAESWPRRWATLNDVQIRGQASVELLGERAGENRLLQSVAVIFNGDRPTEILFPEIPATQRILPGLYRLNFIVRGSNQARNIMPFVYEESEDARADGFMVFRREDPRRAAPMSGDAIVAVAGRDFNGTIISMPLGGAANRERALQEIQLLPALRRGVERQAQQTDMTDVQAQALAMNVWRINYMEPLVPMTSQLQVELAQIQPLENRFQEEIRAYRQRMADEYVAFLREMWQLRANIYWMTNLCRADFHLSARAAGPNPFNPDERINYSVPDMRGRYQMRRYLDAPLDAMRDPNNPRGADPITGKWLRDPWMNWLRTEWMPQAEALVDRFRRLFADPELGIEYGLLPNGQSTIFTAHWPEMYEQLKAAMELLLPMARAHAHSLIDIHTPQGEPRVYEFLDAEGRPDPPADRASRFYTVVDNAVTGGLRTLGVRLAPRPDAPVRETARINPEDIEAWRLGPWWRNTQTGEWLHDRSMTDEMRRSGEWRQGGNPMDPDPDAPMGG